MFSFDSRGLGSQYQSTLFTSLHRFFYCAPLAKPLHLTTDSGMSPHGRMHRGQSDSAHNLIPLASNITSARNGALAVFRVFHRNVIGLPRMKRDLT